MMEGRFDGVRRGIGMVPFPSGDLRTFILASGRPPHALPPTTAATTAVCLLSVFQVALLVDSVGCLVWDRFCVWLWAPHIYKAASVHVASGAMATQRA